VISFVPGYFGFAGNQMFQYAATLALAQHKGVECGWPAGKQPDLYQIFRMGDATRRIPHPEMLWTEKQYHYDPTFWDIPDGTMLSGYFQSPRYFESIEAKVRAAFNFGDDKWLAKRTGDVSIHVRRGDYLSFPEHHPPCSLDYYREAMAKFPGAHFVVFSDDPGWCLLNIKPLGNVEIVTGQSAVQDMFHMSRCAGGHIIANSSFSWWGAWLDPAPTGGVIAPAKWFGPAKKDWDTKDLLPEGWERI